MSENSDSVVDIQINKIGPSGRPVAIVTASSSVALDKLAAAIQKGVTRNTELRARLGLKACNGCASSGFDLNIRDRFEQVMRVDLDKL